MALTDNKGQSRKVDNKRIDACLKQLKGLTFQEAHNLIFDLLEAVKIKAKVN